jgi:ABC-type transport system involved in multi-copper enzyme maturation permease subunit
MMSQSTDAALRHRGSYPMSWRPMVKITWLQHRVALVTGAVLFAATALALTDNALRPRTTQTNTLNLAAIVLLSIPVLVGMFVGAPMLARELESGTFRFAWTQSLGRTRWLAGKMVLLGAVSAAATGALGALAGWYAAPFDSAGLASRWQTGQFAATGVMLATWTLFFFAAGTLAGLITGRVVAAMAATAAFAGCLTVLNFWRLQDFILTAAARVTQSSPSGGGFGALNTFAVGNGIQGPAGSWLVSGWYTGPGGNILSSTAVGNLLTRLAADPSGSAQKAPGAWLRIHHYAYWISYQPASRFWLFQGAEAAILLGLTVLLAAVTVRLARRRLT